MDYAYVTNLTDSEKMRVQWDSVWYPAPGPQGAPRFLEPGQKIRLPIHVAEHFVKNYNLRIRQADEGHEEIVVRVQLEHCPPEDTERVEPAAGPAFTWNGQVFGTQAEMVKAIQDDALGKAAQRPATPPPPIPPQGQRPQHQPGPQGR